jgi:hypothetical protein
VNHAIGAEGIISTDCKEVVSEYGEMILDLLIYSTGLSDAAFPCGFALLIIWNSK